jgi:hypothetical protein
MTEHSVKDLQLLKTVLAIRDILLEANIIEQFSGIVSDWRDLHMVQKFCSIFPIVANFGRNRFLSINRVPDSSHATGIGLIALQEPTVSSDRFLT